MAYSAIETCLPTLEAQQRSGSYIIAASTMPLTPRPLHRLRLPPPCFFTAPYRNINRHSPSPPLPLPPRKLKFNVARSLPRRPTDAAQTVSAIHSSILPSTLLSSGRSRDVFPAYYRAPLRSSLMEMIREKEFLKCAVSSLPKLEAVS